jgi:hypothetical protein
MRTIKGNPNPNTMSEKKQPTQAVNHVKSDKGEDERPSG